MPESVSDGKKDLESWDLFTRQRRNLLVTSAVLFLVTYHEIEPIKDFKFIGFAFNFAKPINAPVILFVAAFYFLLRYYQFARGTWREYIDPALKGITHSLRVKFAAGQFKSELEKEGHTPIGGFRRNLNSPIEKYYVVIEGVINPEGDESKQATANRKITLTKWDRFCIEAHGWWRLFLHTPSATEFFLPFAVAAASILYYLAKNVSWLDLLIWIGL